MIKILNGLFSVLKLIFFVSALCLTLYIIIGMYDRLDKNIMESWTVFLPYFLLLVLFVTNLMLRQTGIQNNIFYNITATLVFATIIVAGLRSLFDGNMLYYQKLKNYRVNFVFFNDFIQFMKIMLYGLVISNIFLIVTNDKEESVVKNKISKSEKDIK